MKDPAKEAQMYASKLKTDEVVLEPSEAADERTIAWLKRDLERRRAEKAHGSKQLAASK